MNIVIAVHHFPPRYTGGAEWEAYRTALALQARGHGVRVLCVERIDAGPERGVTWTDDVYDGISVRRLSYQLAAAPDPLRWEYDNLWIGQHVQDFLCEHHSDLFHLMGGYLLSGRALRAAQALAIPTVVTLMDFWFLCRRISMLRSDGHISTLPIRLANCARCLGEEQRRYRWPGRLAPGLMDVYWRLQKTPIRNLEARMTFLRETLNQVNVIISRSQFLRSTFIQAGVEPERIHFMRQGRDVPGLTPEILEKIPGTGLRVGYIGQIAEHKGVHVLLEAVRCLPGLPLTVSIYGDPAPFPNYTARLRRWTARDKRLEFAGMYRNAREMTEVLRALDVIVVPSLWYENSPNVILEAFAHRTPVVASNLGGMSELVEHEKNGLLFEPGNAADLARQLQRLLNEPGLLSALRAGISPIKSLAEEMDELENLYQQVVTRESSSV
jgi:glycosyltransferase involved in cell wall biosynthesis